MHDPDVVAWEIRRPWSRRDRWSKSGWRFPLMVTVWHQDPGGYDCFDVCKRDSNWRWHVHHWHLQIHALQFLRRRLLTRCAWCGGRDRNGDPVNVSDQWDAPRGKWWRGEEHLSHGDCSSVARAHRLCLCDEPALGPHGYGQCSTCGKFAEWGRGDVAAPTRRMAALAPGERMSPELSEWCAAEWRRIRATRDEAAS